MRAGRRPAPCPPGLAWAQWVLLALLLLGTQVRCTDASEGERGGGGARDVGGEQPDGGPAAADVSDAAPAADLARPAPDQGSLAPMERVVAVPGHPGVWIAAHEAAPPAPDGDAAPPRWGAGLLPWTGLTFPEASAACGKIPGGRLCTHAEWLAACQGLGQRSFPYGDQRQAGLCNDYHAGAGVQPAGQAERCVTPEGVFDLVGNAAEWVDTRSAEGEPFAAGGSALLTALAVSLKLDRCSGTETLPEQMFRRDLGFRCCVDE